MALNLRVPLGDGTSRTVRTSPAHDISLHWPHVLGTALVNVSRGQVDKPLVDLLDRFGQKPIAVIPALLSYIRGLQHMITAKADSPIQSLIACGFYDQPSQLQMAAQYLVGVVATGFWFSAMRDVGDESIVQRLDMLQEMAIKYIKENAELNQSLPQDKPVPASPTTGE